MEEAERKGPGLWSELREMVAFSAFGHLITVAALVLLASSSPPESRKYPVYTVNLVETEEKGGDLPLSSLTTETVTPEPPLISRSEASESSRTNSLPPPEKMPLPGQKDSPSKQLPPAPSQDRPALPRPLAPLHPRSPAPPLPLPYGRGSDVHPRSPAPPPPKSPLAQMASSLLRSTSPKRKVLPRVLMPGDLPPVPIGGRGEATLQPPLRKTLDQEALIPPHAKAGSEAMALKSLDPKILAVAPMTPSVEKRRGATEPPSQLTDLGERPGSLGSSLSPTLPEVARLEGKKEGGLHPPALPSSGPAHGPSLAAPRLPDLLSSRPGPVGRADKGETQGGRSSESSAIVREGTNPTQDLTEAEDTSALVLARKGAKEALTLPASPAIVEKPTPQASGLEPFVQGEYISLDTQDPNLLPYTRPIKERILKAWYYPEDAPGGLKGITELGFTVERDGSVSQVKVLRSAGHQALDRAAIEALKRASPFWPIPPGLNQERLRLAGKFKYNMESRKKE